MALFMVSAIGIVLFAEETRKNWHGKKGDFAEWFKDSVIAPLIDFTRHYRWPAILAFTILFKLGDAFAGSLTLPFLLEIGFSKIEIAGIVKTFGLFATLFGVFVGGILVKKIHIIKSLWIAGIMQMLSNLIFSYLAQIGNDSHLLYAVIFIENFSGGIGDAVFVAYLSGLCSLAFSATQYALLASLASLGRAVLTSSAGVFAQMLGWYEFFIFSAFLAVPGLVFLFFIASGKPGSKKLS
jgi:PAT family beta-lactamase induction signal transducer AmpG